MLLPLRRDGRKWTLHTTSYSLTQWMILGLHRKIGRGGPWKLAAIIGCSQHHSLKVKTYTSPLSVLFFQLSFNFMIVCLSYLSKHYKNLRCDPGKINNVMAFPPDAALQAYSQNCCSSAVYCTFMGIIIQAAMPVGGNQSWRWNKPFSCFMIAIPSPRCFLIQGQLSSHLISLSLKAFISVALDQFASAASAKVLSKMCHGASPQCV